MYPTIKGPKNPPVYPHMNRIPNPSPACCLENSSEVRVKKEGAENAKIPSKTTAKYKTGKEVKAMRRRERLISNVEMMMNSFLLFTLSEITPIIGFNGRLARTIMLARKNAISKERA